MMKFQENIEQRLTGRHKKSFDMVGNVKDKKILDIGCSFGWFEKYAVENGCKEIIGIDTNEKDLSNAKNQIKDKNVKFLKRSVLDLSDFDKNYFDIVAMWEVLEHIPKNTEEKVFQEIARVLKHGGRLFLSTPNNSFFSNVLDPAWYFGHRHYSRKKITQLLSESNLKIEETSCGGGFYELFSMILLYIFKWLLKREMPFKKWFDERRNNEYSMKDGFATLFFKMKLIIK